VLGLGLLRLRFRFCCRLACRQFERFHDNGSKRLPDLHDELLASVKGLGTLCSIIQGCQGVQFCVRLRWQLAEVGNLHGIGCEIAACDGEREMGVKTYPVRSPFG
jgi:hypothetical protein